MFKRYLYTVAGLCALLTLYFLTLLPVIAVRTSLDSSQYSLALSVWAVLAVLFLLPLLNIILKKTWFFRGQGEPVVLELLQEILFAVNENDAPVFVQKRGRKMVVSWRFQEPHWGELMEKKDMRRIYELRLRFDNNTKTVTMLDRYRPVNWDLSPIKIKTGWSRIGAPVLKVATGPEWGVENYEDTLPQNYNFDAGEIKSPVLNTVLKNGWNARFSIF